MKSWRRRFHVNSSFRASRRAATAPPRAAGVTCPVLAWQVGDVRRVQERARLQEQGVQVGVCRRVRDDASPNPGPDDNHVVLLALVQVRPEERARHSAVLSRRQLLLQQPGRKSHPAFVIIECSPWRGVVDLEVGALLPNCAVQPELKLEALDGDFREDPRVVHVVPPPVLAPAVKAPPDRDHLAGAVLHGAEAQRHGVVGHLAGCGGGCPWAPRRLAYGAGVGNGVVYGGVALCTGRADVPWPSGIRRLAAQPRGRPEDIESRFGAVV